MIGDLLVSPFVDLLGLASDLLKRTGDKKATRFDKLVDPIYLQLRTIHQDYLKILTALKKTLEQDGDLKRAAGTFEVDRLKREALRDSVRSIALALSQEKRLKKYKPFFESVHSYFHTSVAGKVKDPGYNSRTFMLLDMMLGGSMSSTLAPTRKSGSEAQKEIVRLMLKLLRVFLSELRNSWKKVSAAYAKVLGASS